ncbi:uncharacterized protein LOC126746588 [Anthonomus grandis grandis]|uniref:uncharacterized protein LOC126746588 n=1 Tax=Anthonomus grandis grandis TaxID=2921223 RepID=UPI002166BF32|nr:uncharacterized protein LOC126746588 [Anthonomus grandis grandis]
MPTEYKRKCPEGARWTKEELVAALQAIESGEMGINQASRNFGIPLRTLRRRRANNNTEKTGLGPSSILGKHNEEKLVLHIKKIQSRGFAPTRDDVRHIAYKFATALGIGHRFNVDSERAGYDWLNSFLRRNSSLSVRKSEGVSVARAVGMSRPRVTEYFELLVSILQKNDIMTKPGHIYNMDESGLQLCNKATQVIATKGFKQVSSITSGEKGETILVIACCNAEGTILPLVFIMKGKNKKAEYEDAMPPGSYVYMSAKSAYINSKISVEQRVQ